MTHRPDFAALRAARDEARRKLVAVICAEQGAHDIQF